MKKPKFQPFFNLSLLLALFVLYSCNETDSDDQMATSELEASYEVSDLDLVNEGINDIVDNAYTEVELFALAKEELSKEEQESMQKDRFLSDCVTISVEMTDTHKEVTLDYGEGCTTRRDNFLSGKIIMMIVKESETPSKSIDYSFDNFYFNGVNVQGTVNKVRMRQNEDGLPEAHIVKDLTITWEDGSIASLESDKTRIMIEGAGNLFWGDNVFQITGNRTYTRRNGVVRTATIVEPLIRNMACRFIVSGTVEIEKDGEKSTLDYGDGECDATATVTKGDQTIEILLRKKRK